MSIQPGDRVEVRTAGGEWLPKRALSGAVDGADFPVVWVCGEDEYDQAHTGGVPSRMRDSRGSQARHREYPPGRPWPMEDVRLA